MQRLHARSSVSISDLKKNPSGVISQSKGEPVVILGAASPTGTAPGAPPAQDK